MAIKILLLSHAFYPKIGGIETISELLANSFSTAGHEVHLLTWSEEVGEKSFSFLVIRNPSLRIILKEHLWSDIIFENNLSLRLSWPRLIFKRPSIVVLQTWVYQVTQKKGAIHSLKLWWLKKTTVVIAISNAVRSQNWSDAAIIANSYDTDHFRISPNIQRNRDFAFIGRLVSDKGADMAIKALKQLLSSPLQNGAKVKDHFLTIIGDGPDRPYLERLVKQLKLEKNVQFKGSLVGIELAKILNQHRFVLVPSIWEEPFGIVALEGMACGCLPIVSDGGGLPEAVGAAGLTFKRGNMDDFVYCLKNIIENPELEKQIRNEAKSHLDAHHPKVISGKYLRIIESMVSPAKKMRKSL